MQNKFITRDQFREYCLKRDGYKCVICKKSGELVVHHILERRLFSKEQQYEKNNGASLCGDCHLKAEMTTLSVEDIREACGIPESKKIIPEHLYDDQPYDKWGNPVLSNGTRMMGDLFDNTSVQKALDEGNVLNLFTPYVKYPRTWHLPFSPGATKDDRTLKDCSMFEGKEVVVTVKMDGENTTLYKDNIHSRSLNDKKHWSKSWIKNLHGTIAHEIPENMRIVVENLYAKHTIHYQNLDSYCYGIAIWQGLRCLSWSETVEDFRYYGFITPVPVLYSGIWDEKAIKELYTPHFEGDECEGYVVRLAGEFHYRDFSKSVAKYVRKGHVAENDEHWFYGKVGVKNKLKEEKDEYRYGERI